MIPIQECSYPRPAINGMDDDDEDDDDDEENTNRDHSCNFTPDNRGNLHRGPHVT